jgi:hypothetical protein
MVEIVLCCRLQFGDGTIAIVLFGWHYSDGNSRFAFGMVEILAHCCKCRFQFGDATIVMELCGWCYWDENSRLAW